jgi:hypothetical protein
MRAGQPKSIPSITSWPQALGSLPTIDWFEAPVIHRIERAGECTSKCTGECIRVQASDNILVTRVRVSVLGEGGTVLEYGEAIRAEENWWEFATHTEGKTIVAEAWDLAENVTKLGPLLPPPNPEYIF